MEEKLMKKALSLFLTAVMLLGVLSVFTVLPVSAETVTWTAEQPKGSGTKEDPYLIATPGNFVWLSDNVTNPHLATEDTDGDGNKDFRPYNISATSFVGSYFEQVCDIDFQGANIMAVGGYIADTNKGDTSKEDGKIYGGFGGNYNGNGFALQNANVISRNTKDHSNDNWCVGLFAVIYGATLKNMVLENIDVTSYDPCSGILVGKAYAPTLDYNNGEPVVHADAGKADFNVIENIVIDKNCSLTATTGRTKINHWGDGVKAGAIAGVALGTTIRNCTFDGTINAAARVVTCVGGIVGLLARATVVDHCINNGVINITAKPDTNTSNGAETAIGGIVGALYCSANGYTTGCQELYSKVMAGMTISNCWNNSTVTVSSSGIPGSHCWGGIVGGTNTLTEITDEAGDHTYLMENCYNTSTGIKTAATRKGGLVGSSWISAGAAVDTLYVKNSLSIDISEGCTDTSYVGTNEFTYKNRQTADALPQIMGLGVNGICADGTTKVAYPGVANGNTLATRALTDWIYVEKADGTGYELSETITFQNVVDKLADEIELAQAYGKTVVALGHQKGLDGTSNAGAYRLVFGIHKLEYCNVGVTVAKTVEGGSTTFAYTKSDVVYSSVKAYGANGEETVNASDLGVEYLTTLTINDIPAEGTVTYVITTYVTNRDTAKTTTGGDIITVKFVDGALTSATIS